MARRGVVIVVMNIRVSRKCVIPVVCVKLGKGMQSDRT